MIIHCKQLGISKNSWTDEKYVTCFQEGSIPTKARFDIPYRLIPKLSGHGQRRSKPYSLKNRKEDQCLICLQIMQ